MAATKGGLLLAEKQREDIRYIKASVISPGEEATKAGLLEGDLIYYDRHAGHTIEIEGDHTPLTYAWHRDRCSQYSLR